MPTRAEATSTTRRAIVELRDSTSFTTNERKGWVDMNDDIATKYKINSHRTTVLHDDTLVVTVSDPIEYVERAHSVKRRLQALNALLAGALQA